MRSRVRTAAVVRTECLQLRRETPTELITESDSQCEDEHRVRRRRVRTHSYIARSRCGYHKSTSAPRIRSGRGPSYSQPPQAELRIGGARSHFFASRCSVF